MLAFQKELHSLEERFPDMDNGEPVSNEPLIPGLVSKKSEKPCLVRFMNCTGQAVEIVWISFEGIPTVYKVLPPYLFFHLKTYETHPWVFRIQKTREKCQVGACDVFMPSASENTNFRDIVGSVTPRFKTYVIHLPVYSLKARACQVIKNSLRDISDVHKLHLPTILKRYIENHAEVFGHTNIQ